MVVSLQVRHAVYKGCLYMARVLDSFLYSEPFVYCLSHLPYECVFVLMRSEGRNVGSLLKYIPNKDVYVRKV